MAVINRIFSGSGGKGVLSYVLHDKDASTTERVEVIASTFCSDDLPGMSRELRELYQARKAIGKEIPTQPIRHFVLSLPTAEKLTNDQWQGVASKFMRAMGFDGQPLLVVRHTDTDKDHCHIVSSRIRPDGTLIPDGNERHKAHKATQEIAAALGLATLPDRSTKQLSKPASFDILKPITASRLAEMKQGKQYALAKLCKAVGADLSTFGPELMFCTSKEGRTVAKLKDNTRITFQGGNFSINAPSKERREAVASMLGHVLIGNTQRQEFSRQEAFIAQRRQALRDRKKSSLPGEQKVYRGGDTPTPQKLEQRGTANAWALSASPAQREAHREAVESFQGFQAMHANATAQNSAYAPALAVIASSARAVTKQIDALNVEIAQCQDPAERSRLIGQVISLEQQRAFEARREVEQLVEAATREEERKTQEAKASIRRKPRF